MTTHRAAAGVLLGLFITTSAPRFTAVHAQGNAATTGAIAETPAERDRRMRWWREARFGMFIHWGLYAVPAGDYKGKRDKEIGEWIMSWANIPRAEYEKFAPQFNPTAVRRRRVGTHRQGRRDEVHRDHLETPRRLLDVRQPRQPTTTSWTPRRTRRTSMKALAAEAKRQGLKFCFYYSIMDWHHPSQTADSAKKHPTAGDHKTKMRPSAEGRVRRLHEGAAPGTDHGLRPRGSLVRW